jgi:cyclopropane-fatty-acyl-phospholipid synthase
MTQSASLTLPAHTTRTAWQRFARRAVFGQLQKLHTGALVIVEGTERHHFGESTSLLSGELHIHDASCYGDILVNGSIGAAESFMTGDWDTPDLTALVRVMVRNTDVLDQIEGGLARLSRPALKLAHWFNRNTEKGSKRNIAAHYDLGNGLFRQFLDPNMMYSSAIFPTADTGLDEAADHKLKVICERLQLSPQDHVIEIGSGWGGFALYAAQHYGCRVTTTTISENQYALARQRIEAAGLSDRITLLKRDYRQLDGQFDKLVSIEMIEAVGWQYYDTFFATCSRLLKADGLALIQAITITDQRYDQARHNVDFIQSYIFPGSCIPSVQALLTASAQSSDLRLIEQQDYAEHYARTLKAWWERFQCNRAAIAELGYDETFARMWQFYLCYCEGGFHERSIGVSHLLFAKPLNRV